MAYATLQDLIDRFTEDELLRLTDRDGNDAIDADAVARALSDADALIDGYVGSRYALPLASVPPLLVTIASDLARYQLYDDRVTETVTKRRDQAIASLKAIAAGTIALPAGETETPTPAAGDSVRFDAPDRVFTRDSLKGF